MNDMSVHLAWALPGWTVAYLVGLEGF